MDEWWCQGYSEPGAGSDLASLTTRAERKGDHYVVNGQKTWTSFAHWADWIFCLVRTSTQGKPQQGISFLLIDMKTPGVKVKPIRTLDQGHDVNEVFLDNVVVPVVESRRRGESRLVDSEIPARTRTHEHRRRRHVQAPAAQIEGIAARADQTRQTVD